MRVPESLAPLVDQGVIDEVVRPLMSGKEAQVYLVRAGGETRIAKVYKTAQNRSFKHRADYTEGRKVRGTRQQRAMSKRSKHGREEVEEAWRVAEVDAIYRLRAANVRVPEPYDFVEGVLVMELIASETGEPALRLVDVAFDEDEAKAVFETLLREVVKMLCAGVVHGDLSDFNVLMGASGPVLIDFPQFVDPAHNRNARKLLIRDVENLTSFFARFVPELRTQKYGLEMWDLYERNLLNPDTELTGKFKRAKTSGTDTNALLAEIEEVEREARKRREALGLPPRRPARKPIVYEEASTPRPIQAKEQSSKRAGRSRKASGPPPNDRQQPSARSQKAKQKGSATKSADPFDDLDALLSMD